jgi:SAM domain (Sterile alpha motif)
MTPSNTRKPHTATNYQKRQVPPAQRNLYFTTQNNTRSDVTANREKEKVHVFLKNLNLQQYANLLVNNGFDSVASLGTLNETLLDMLGILMLGDRTMFYLSLLHERECLSAQVLREERGVCGVGICLFVLLFDPSHHACVSIYKYNLIINTQKNLNIQIGHDSQVLVV